VKIDQAFAATLEDDTGDLALCEAIIVMAHKLGLKVVAEGVETRVQRALLQDAGCDYAQGFMFAHPMPPEQFEEMARANRG
jgi:EAL domain-containing protein (putative c-di-GMP-specific phosphodiesterase class I)